MVKITGVTFTAGGKVYFFAPGKDKYEKGMGVVVDTARGLEYATVLIPYGEVEDDKIVGCRFSASCPAASVALVGLHRYGVNPTFVGGVHNDVFLAVEVNHAALFW